MTELAELLPHASGNRRHLGQSRHLLEAPPMAVLRKIPDTPYSRIAKKNQVRQTSTPTSTLMA